MRKTLVPSFGFSYTGLFSLVNQTKYEGDLAWIPTWLSLGGVAIARRSDKSGLNRPDDPNRTQITHSS